MLCEKCKKNNDCYLLETDDDYIEHYIKMIDDDELDEDLKDDLRLYVDAQSEVMHKKIRG